MSIAAALLNAQSPLNAVAAPTYAYASRSGAGSTTTSAVTVTVTGGEGTPTYSWAYLSGDNTFSATAPTAATTRFTTTLSLGDLKTSVWRCTVNSGSGVATVDVDISATEISFGYL